jgi:ABC-2 type transport system ATP-binding protein
MTDGRSALVVRDLSYAYDRQRQALDQVSFDVDYGRCTILLGPNGAGKTTLLALLTRLFRAHGGRIVVAGHDMEAAPLQALARLGIVFQQPSLDLDLSVRQNLAYAGRLQGLGERRMAARIAVLVEQMAIADRLSASARSLSGGLRRRVEIARALLHEPTVLVLDEPTVGLDIDSRQAIVQAVHDLARDGLAVLWTTHLIDEIADDDDLVVLHQGKVRAAGAIAQVLEPGEDVAAAFRRLTRP